LPKRSLVDLLDRLHRLMSKCCVIRTLRGHPYHGEAECLNIVESVYNRFPVEHLSINLSDIVNWDHVIDKITSRFKPERLSLHIDGFKHPKDFLSKVAEVVDEMYIHNMDNNARYILNQSRDDWAETVLEILSKRCSRIWINHDTDMNEEHLDCLLEGLSNLNKKVHLRIRAGIWDCEYEKYDKLHIEIEGCFLIIRHEEVKDDTLFQYR
ncbi:hypothetical protein PFISCL1PPCAC_518, partial [Pristionchus fissidentatus]